MSARRSVAIAIAALGAGVLYAPSAAAFDVPVGDETLTVDITNSIALSYYFDNRNDTEGVLSPPSTVVDDTYGEFVDQFNVQAFYAGFRANVRVDMFEYFAQLTDTDLRDIAKEELPNATGAERYEYENEFRRELNTRYLPTIYPSKFLLGYTKSGVDFTLGDFYAQLGRGIVLSVRKVDELAQDTTLRGFKASFKKSWSDASLSVTALAGQGNPLRVDPQSGRRLHGDGSWLFPGMPTANDFTYYTFNDQGSSEYITIPARPNYLEDTIYGVGVEAGPRLVQFGGNVSILQRKSYAEPYTQCTAAGAPDCATLFPTFSTTNPSRLRDLVITSSGTVNFPNIAKHGDFYVEVAAQHNTDGRPTGVEDGGFARVADLTGYGVYAAGTISAGPVVVTLETKHYRSLLPLAANISSDGVSDPTFGAPEFATVVYNQPPNADTFYQEPLGAPNICITGGRARVDYRLTREFAVYGWLGYFSSLTEDNANNVECSTENAQLETRTVDSAAGAELVFESGRSFIKAWIGGRDVERAEPIESVNTGGESSVFYREGYIRYDLQKHLAGDFTLQSQGFHRRRFEPTLAQDPWMEGENYLALRWAPHFAFIFGYEYLGRPGCSSDPEVDFCHYFSGAVQFKAAGRENAAQWFFDTVNLFVGQRRGAIRCVSGVCRQFPPFEGARLELTSRF
ncbi:MAG: hypothetical protein U0271_12790 [Polyangiaceae bacterium]